jgi:hypothetical protein
VPKVANDAKHCPGLGRVVETAAGLHTEFFLVSNFYTTAARTVLINLLDTDFKDIYSASCAWLSMMVVVVLPTLRPPLVVKGVLDARTSSPFHLHARTRSLLHRGGDLDIPAYGHRGVMATEADRGRIVLCVAQHDCDDLKMRIVEVPDMFNVRRFAPVLGFVRPSERTKLLKYIENYCRECEREDHKLPSQRRGVNRG